MKLFIKLLSLLIVSLGWLHPTYAHVTNASVIVSQTVRVDKLSAVLPQLKQANIIYLGETHGNLQDHQLQLQIIQALQQRQPKIAIALEMFQRPYQKVIDQYLAGKLTETQLLAQTEYDQRWGFPWEYYAPILRFARANNLPVLALNTPTQVTRQVARAGLESLTPQQRQYIPPLSEIHTDNLEYRQMLFDAFQQHQHAGHGNSAQFENFFLTQVLWDETMADKIAQFFTAKPNYQIVVLAGQGHIVYGYGIPSRVARRLHHKRFVQRSLLFSNPPDAVNTNKSIADFILDMSGAEEEE